MYSLFFVLLSMNINAQNTFPATGSAGIGTTVPNASALLEMKSTGKGLLIPRMTSDQRDLITAPASGLLIYQTNNTKGFYFYSGSAWTPLVSKGWSLTGNGGTVPGTNFLGTTDAQPLMLKVNNQKSGYIDYNGTKANTALGYQTLLSNTTGAQNTAMGYQSLYTNATGFANTSAGLQSLYLNTSGYQNTATGLYALRNNTSGYNNTATGLGALLINGTGNSNTANGYSALSANTSGSNNTAAGSLALLSNTSGFSNVGIGANALSGNTTRGNLVAIGDSALYNNGKGVTDSSEATENTAVGSKNALQQYYRNWQYCYRL